MESLKWGLKVQKGMMMPIPMRQAPAPPELLKIFRCDCKTGCKTFRCTCMKHGLKCTQVCGECRGVSCINSQEINLELDEDDVI